MSAERPDEELAYSTRAALVWRAFSSSASLSPISPVCSVVVPSIARAAADTDSPFGEGQWVVSAGFCLTALVVLPLSSLGLDDNVGVQIASTALLVAILSAWCAEFAADAVGAGGGGGAGALAAGGAPPAVGDSFSFLWGSVLFNFAFVLTLPSWLCEKCSDVGVARSCM